MTSEHPYECQGDLGDHATDLIWYVYETAPGDPDEMVLHGRTRKSGRKFGVVVKLEDRGTVEVCAMAFLEEQGELVTR